jgi:DNA-binding GntR family transcriptional regulator
MSVTKTSIKDQVYDLIKTRILTQEYPLESRLNINALTSEMDVSNTPVREALSMLQKDGLVTFSTNAGYQVFSFPKENIEDLKITMSVLMIGGFNMFRYHGETDRLVRLLEEKLSVQKRLPKRRSLMEKAMTAIGFDSALFYKVQSATIKDTYQNLLDKMVLLICSEYKSNHYDLENSIEDHIRILDAIKADDIALVSELIAQHFNRSTDL